MYYSFCQKLEKSNPFVDQKGVEIWDGTNNVIPLYYGGNQSVVKSFLINVSNNQRFVKWKFWMLNDDKKKIFEFVTEVVKVKPVSGLQFIPSKESKRF